MPNNRKVSSSPAEAIRQSRVKTTGGSPVKGGGGGGALMYPSQKPAMGTAFRFRSYQYAINGSKANITRNISDAHIFLPLPQQLTEGQAVGYGSTDIGLAGQMFAKGFEIGDNVSSAIGEKFGGAGGNVRAMASGMGSDAGAFVLRSLVATVSQELASSINLSQGNIPNPYTVATFERVEIRQHQLTFKMFPQSKEESDMVQMIIDKFRIAALPSKQGMFLTMPDEVEVEFFGTNKLYNFAPCVIRNINVNYIAQGGMPFFAGTKAPTGIELQLSLGEIEPLTRNSYAGTNAGNSPHDPAVGVAIGSSGFTANTANNAPQGG